MFKISNSLKKNIAQVLCLTIAFTPVIGYAAETSRADNLQSHGKVNYTNGTDNVVIDSSDLVTLANEIDTLEENAKWGQVQALQSLPAVAQKNSLTGVTLDTVENVTFDQINNAIKNSQKIDTTQSVYKLPNGSVTTNSAEEGATQVQISGATAENLSAGTAAWVDGQYIVGNGADNNSYYAKGYSDGYQKSQDSVSVTYQYHQHIGDSTSGTGCYTKAITKTVQTGTENYSYHPTVSDDDGNGTENCGNCGTKIYTGPYGSTECGCLCTGSRPVYGTVVDHYEINCGKTTSTIERAIITF